MTRRRRGGYNHGNPPGWRPPPGEWYHGDELDAARQAAARRGAGRWDPARRRRRGPPLSRWMWEAFGVVAGWVAVVGAARLGVAGPPGSRVPTATGCLVVVAAPLAAWWYAGWKRTRDPAGLAPAELAAAWAVPAALAAAAYRLGTGPGQRWLLAAWAGWWLAAWGWVRIIRPPERRAASYARTRIRRARAGARRRARPARGPARRDPLAAAARWAAAAGRACAAGAAWLVLGPLAEEDPDPVADLDRDDDEERAWSPPPRREPWVRPSERRVPAYAGAVAGRERVRDPAPVPDAPRPEPAAPPRPTRPRTPAVEGVPERDAAVLLQLLRAGRKVTSGEAAGALGKTPETARVYLAALAGAGLAVREGAGRGSGFRAPS